MYHLAIEWRWCVCYGHVRKVWLVRFGFFVVGHLFKMVFVILDYAVERLSEVNLIGMEFRDFPVVGIVVLDEFPKFVSVGFGVGVVYYSLEHWRHWRSRRARRRPAATHGCVRRENGDWRVSAVLTRPQASVLIKASPAEANWSLP